MSPALSPDGASLAWLSDPDAYDEAVKKEPARARAFRLMVADTHGGAPVEALGAATPGLAPRTFATDARTPEFSADGSRLALWTANVPLPRPSSAPARVDLDFWYWRDGELPTQQRRAAENPQHGTYLALYDVAARRLTQLGTRDVPQVSLARHARYALGASDAPYVKLATYDARIIDAYRIDVATGARTLLARKLEERRAEPVAGRAIRRRVRSAAARVVHAPPGGRSQGVDHRSAHGARGAGRRRSSGDAAALRFRRLAAGRPRCADLRPLRRVARVARRRHTGEPHARRGPRGAAHLPRGAAAHRRARQRVRRRATGLRARAVVLSVVDDRTKASGFAAL